MLPLKHFKKEPNNIKEKPTQNVVGKFNEFNVETFVYFLNIH